MGYSAASGLDMGKGARGEEKGERIRDKRQRSCLDRR